MKKLLLLLFFSTSFLNAQVKDSVISENVSGHIYKPQLVEPGPDRMAQLQLPQGFRIEKFAEDLGEPRIIRASPQGHIYVTRRQGDILMLQDKDQDGRADQQQTVLTKEGVHGLAIHEDMLYYVTVNEVFRAPLKEDGSLGAEEKIMENLPDGGQHPNRTLAFGPDGKLYISVGSTCNACAETRDENATLIQADADGKNRKIFAKGLRNTIGFDWHPETGELFGMDHGIDWLGDDEQKEELNRITEGSDYGWPYIYADGKFNKADKPKDMSWEKYAAKTVDPELLFTAHSAPMAFEFYEGDMFPTDYKNSALVTFRGSWNRQPPSGYKIMRVDFDNGKPVKAEDLVKGFLSEDGTQIFARPVGLAQLPDGSVLMTDDTNGVIYRISY